MWKGKPPPVEAFEASRATDHAEAANMAERTPAPVASHVCRTLQRALQPSRAEMRANLTKVGEAASLLIKALGSSAIVEFLDLGADRPAASPRQTCRRRLSIFAIAAAAASRSSALVDSRGRTKAGRGRALPKAGISAQAYCALLIAEAWLYFRGNYPSPGNKQAAEATDIYWRLLGGELQSWGSDKLVAWRGHFRKASKRPVRRK